MCLKAGTTTLRFVRHRGQRSLNTRVIAAADDALARQGFVTPIDMCSAAGRSLDEQAITLAVVASVRHEDTDYDSLLMSGVGREMARDRIRPAVDRVLSVWV